MSPLTHYFCRFGFYVNVSLLSRPDVCFTKMHNYLVLKMNIFAHSLSIAQQQMH
jgi:hypothetical protein